MSTAQPISKRESSYGFPLSRVSKFANGLASRSMRSAKRKRSFPRAEASIFRHSDPRAKATDAARTAKSTSALSPSATLANFFPVAGLIVENVLPLFASRNSLLIKIYTLK